VDEHVTFSAVAALRENWCQIFGFLTELKSCHAFNITYHAATCYLSTEVTWRDEPVDIGVGTDRSKRVIAIALYVVLGCWSIHHGFNCIMPVSHLALSPTLQQQASNAHTHTHTHTHRVITNTIATRWGQTSQQQKTFITNLTLNKYTATFNNHITNHLSNAALVLSFIQVKI